MSLFFLLPSGSPVVVTVTGSLIIDDDSTGDRSCRVRFNTDGTVDGYTNDVGSYFQLSTLTDWLRPSGAPGTYHIKAVEVSQTDLLGESGTMDTWTEISSAQEWICPRLNAAGTGVSEWVIDISISDDAGSTTLDTGRYTLQAELF